MFDFSGGQYLLAAGVARTPIDKVSRWKVAGGQYLPHQLAATTCPVYKHLKVEQVGSTSLAADNDFSGQWTVLASTSIDGESRETVIGG